MSDPSPAAEANRHVRGLLQKLAPFVFLIVIAVALSFASENFLTFRNIITILLQISVIGIIAVGQTPVMITAGIDLSVGGIVGLAGVVTASETVKDTSAI